GKYDGVILATGAKPAIPPIEGLEEYFWAEVLEEDNFFENRKVVIIGGGLIGIEIAHKLAQRNNYVIVVEMLDEIARGMEMIERAITLKSLDNNENVKVYKNTKVTRIDGRKVYLEGERNEVIDDVDHIILSVGMVSYNPLEEKLAGKIPVYVVGDAKKVGKAKDAIASAFEVASKI
ncbi:oxidoreductase, partial [bacterium]